MYKNKKGFTLIELMIVVAIIGILAAIAIPKFADLWGKAKIRSKYRQELKAKPYDKDRLIREMNAEIAKFDKRYETSDPSHINLATEIPYHTYRLSDGTEVECKKGANNGATISLADCKDGKTYFAQTNVTMLN